ncbi:hypothetical protein H9638_16030 [Arthrobacter sp. Sa2BUA2]|uniref:Uncharacterized protein n=1 Tax=Arthrobacter pullicola TaxID=2762224 RepID=A0ABR8YM69_9MICC|nr:hypothetical protein [Arthrobacter pullicola]MBD8045318.1 hypothetical protein [Arthrobacter pullicola]
MGRHRAEPVGKRRDRRVPKPRSGRPKPRRNPELLGWGLFLTGTSAVCLLWAEVPLALAAGLTALLLAAFLTAWYLSAGGSTTAAVGSETAGNRSNRAAASLVPGTPDPGAAPSAPEPNSAEPSSRRSPVSGADRSTAAAVPAIPLAPEAVQEFLGLPRPRPAAAAAGGTSRWTRTFGPPETGSLPLQPYVPARRSTVQTADPQGQDRRQRSHSSH